MPFYTRPSNIFCIIENEFTEIASAANTGPGEAHDYGRIDVQVSRHEVGHYGSTRIASCEHRGVYMEGVASARVSQVFCLNSSMPVVFARGEKRTNLVRRPLPLTEERRNDSR